MDDGGGQLTDFSLHGGGRDRRGFLRIVGGGIAAGSLAACRTAVAAPLDADVLIDRVTLVPMATEGVIAAQSVAVRGGLISAILPQAEAARVRAARRIDGRGLHLMPALTDMHVHVEGDPQRDFPLYLANGVTTVRNMSDREFDHRRIRREVESGVLEGPRYVISGPSLTDRNLKSVDEVAPMLDRHVALGFDLVKIHGTLAPAVYDAVIAGARQRRLKTSGHVQQGRPLADSLRMSTIEHAEEFLNVPGRAAISDADSAAAIAAQVAASGAYVTPTLVVFDAISAYLDDKRFDALKRRPELRYLAAGQRQLWQDAATNPYRARIRKPEAIGALASAVPLLQRFTGLLHKAGVPLLLGTDAAGLLVPGFSLHDELKLLVASGLSPFEALRTGTVNAARFLGDQAAGTIEVGKRAELIMIEGNPLSDIGNAARVRAVFSRGRWHDSAALSAMLARTAERQSPEPSPYALQ